MKRRIVAMHALALPEDFLWGAATASCRIEGATRKGDRSECIRDTFARKPGTVYADYQFSCDLIACLAY